MFSAAPVHFPPSPAGFSTAAASIGAVQAGLFRELAQSAEILSRLADSRPDGYLRPADLTDIASNRHGQFRRDQQMAARMFLVNPRVVGRARDHVRRTGANAHSCAGGGRAYDYYDLQSMCRYMLHDIGQSHPEGMGYQPFYQREPAFAYRHSLRGAIDDVIGHMLGRGRRHMSLERLMSMQYHGHGGAGLLLGNIAMLDAMIDRLVFRNVAISVDRMRHVGHWMDTQPSDHLYFDPAEMASTAPAAGQPFAGMPPMMSGFVPPAPSNARQMDDVIAQASQNSRQYDIRRQQDRRNDDIRRQQDRLATLRRQQDLDNFQSQQQQRTEDIRVQERLQISREHLQRDITSDRQEEYRHQLDFSLQHRRQEMLNEGRLNEDRLEDDRRRERD